MKNLKITIGHLYGDLMNTYGDDGNIICLRQRCIWQGIKVETRLLTLDSRLSKGECDLYFFGGGQDQAQVEVGKDLLGASKKALKGELDRGVPLLSICGGYQLLGEYYRPHQGPKIEGLGVLPVYTNASYDRMIGNLVIEMSDISSQSSVVSSQNNLKSDSSLLSTALVGFENHSGKTYLKPGATPLGKVIKGFGNNGEDQTEGCIYKNVIGCYMHGSLLPKNPQLADWLISKALEVKYGKTIDLESLDDEIENKAHQKALQMFS